MGPTCQNDVEDIIQNMQTGKACGLNSIPKSNLKTFKKELSKLLSDIINLSFLTGTFPKTMKIAKIIPVFKRDDKLNCNNYRPISLLPNLSKIFKKLMHHRLTLFLENNKKFFQIPIWFQKQPLFDICFNQLNKTNM